MFDFKKIITLHLYRQVPHLLRKAEEEWPLFRTKSHKGIGRKFSVFVCREHIYSDEFPALAFFL